jgi:hypothetical protein
MRDPHVTLVIGRAALVRRPARVMSSVNSGAAVDAASLRERLVQ